MQHVATNLCDSTMRERIGNESHALLWPKSFLHLAAFNVCTLSEVGQLAAQARTDGSVSSAPGRSTVGIALSTRVGCALLDWTPSNSCLHAVLYMSNIRLECRFSFVMSVCAPSDYSSSEAED